MHLVCVHGLSGSTKWWSAVLPDLERRFDVHLLDLRKVRPRDGAAWIADRVSGLDRPVLVGHSLGGLLCAELAARHPELPARLVLAAPAGLPTGRSIPLEVFGALNSMRAVSPRFLPMLAVDAMRWGPHGLLRGGLYARGRDLQRDLARIEVPTLVLWGERDSLVPVRLAETWRDAIPNARLELIPRAGHVPMVENPSAFARAVLDFLDEALDEPGDLTRGAVVDGVRAVGDGDLSPGQ